MFNVHTTRHPLIRCHRNPAGGAAAVGGCESDYSDPIHSAVIVQGLASFDHRKLTRRMGELNTAQMAEVKTALRDLLGL
jgi:mRNA-degrading endonuclease toxin of MazEF toxin-antitoxin module